MEKYKCIHGYGITKECPTCKQEENLRCRISTIMIIGLGLIFIAMYLVTIYFPD